MKRSYIAVGLIFLVLLIDQIVKIWVKLNMQLGQSFNFLGGGQDWFQIYFTENPGMAFGIELGGDYGKLALSLFRIIAVGFITYYLYLLIKQKKSYGLISSISLIWAGAVGNILDSIFYGLIFTKSTIHSVATVSNIGEGYAGFLHGKVVDMLYFPLIEGHYPRWFPFVGGEHFQFFQPIFNIADSSISVGVCLVILFYRRFFNDLNEDKKSPTELITTEPISAMELESLSSGESNSLNSNNQPKNTNREISEVIDIPLDLDEEKP